MKCIIGVHGLANKPKPEILTDWWKASINEGLHKNCQITAPRYEFQMAYWAEHLHAYPLHQNARFPFDPNYLHEIYYEARPGALQSAPDETVFGRFRENLGVFVGRLEDYLYKCDILDPTSNWVLKRCSLLQDLALYYDDPVIHSDGRNDFSIKSIVQKVLKDILLTKSNTELMIIGHSMGSIVAYDVLRDIGRLKADGDPNWANFECQYFVTIGSPLGLGKVKDHIRSARGYDSINERLRTPSVVTKDWKNFSEKRDPVCLDAHLRDDYGENEHGIQVIDNHILNDYCIGDPPKHNFHKSYGYLRTPDMSRHIRRFLNE